MIGSMRMVALGKLKPTAAARTTWRIPANLPPSKNPGSSSLGFLVVRAQRALTNNTASMDPAKTVLVPIANGTEEIEAVCIIDTLRRAGAHVTVASVEDSKEVACARKTHVVADELISHCHGPYDLIALPGGMPGAKRLKESEKLKSLLIHQKKEHRHYAAICASPAVVLAAHGLLDDKQATCYPSFEDVLPNKKHLEDRVVVDGLCITSRGPGTALEFSLQLVEQLYGKAKAHEVQKGLLVPSY